MDAAAQQAGDQSQQEQGSSRAADKKERVIGAAGQQTGQQRRADQGQQTEQQTQEPISRAEIRLVRGAQCQQGRGATHRQQGQSRKEQGDRRPDKGPLEKGERREHWLDIGDLRRQEISQQTG